MKISFINIALVLIFLALIGLITILVFFYYQFIILANYVEDGSNEIEKLNDYLEQFTEILSKFEKKAEDFFAEK
jgi:predicted PurR-regulated permease PerM